MVVPVLLRVVGTAVPETVYAEPAGAGTAAYRLTQSALTAPLAAGDLVACAQDTSGALQVVDVVEPADAVLTVFAAAPDHAEALVALWTATGAGTTRREGPVLVTTWPGVPMDAVAQQLNGDEDAGRGEWLLAAEPHERVRAAQQDVDFALG
jgi:hypothetical protein